MSIINSQNNEIPAALNLRTVIAGIGRILRTIRPFAWPPIEASRDKSSKSTNKKYQNSILLCVVFSYIYVNQVFS